MHTIIFMLSMIKKSSLCGKSDYLFVMDNDEYSWKEGRTRLPGRFISSGPGEAKPREFGRTATVALSKISEN